MRTSLSQNLNLTLHECETWHALPINSGHGPLIDQYLLGIYETMFNAVREYPRTCAMRFDLHYPAGGQDPQGRHISRFIASLNAQLEADALRRKKARKDRRAHPCRLRYVWVKEQARALLPHYHVFVFVNRDAYFCLGDFRQRHGLKPDDSGTPYHERRENMAERIVQAWASSLAISPIRAWDLVHFPRSPVHSIDANSPSAGKEFAEVFERASYFAKARTKKYGDYSRCFGRSRC